MSFTRWLASMQRRLRSPKPSRRRPLHPLSGIQDWLLEDRCLLSQSIFVAGASQNAAPIGPYTLQNEASDPGTVIFLGGTNPNTGSFNWGNVPQKSVTFTNDSSNHQTIYPFLYSANTNKTYDPIDTSNDEYRLYIGYQQNGQYILGLPYKQSITINVPLVFWNGGRADIATDGANLIPQPNQVFTLNPFQFRYSASTYIGTQGVISSTDNGILMYYKANTPNAPNDPSPAASGQLTEWTIRDQAFLNTVNGYDVNNNVTPIPASELTTLINYDVSYVDDMLAPVAMVGNQVPVPIQYIQLGTATQAGNTTTIGGGLDAALLQLLTTTYPYQQYPWQVKYSSSPTSTVNVGTVTNINNGVVTVTSNQPVSGLPTTPAAYVFYTNAVTQDYGWTGANNDIVSMQNAMSAFTSNNSSDQNVNGLGKYFGGLGWPSYYNPNSNALLKIPSGASILINSPLTATTSPYTNGNYYLLTSGNNGTQILYNAHENLSTSIPPSQSNIPAGTQVTFQVSGADLAAIKKQGGTWVLSTSLNTAATNPIGTIDVNSIDTANQTITATLNQSIPNNPSGYSYLIVAPPTDPYSTKLTNLWYSWANYYVQQLSNVQPLTISANVSADTDSTSDTRVLTFAPQDQSKASQLMLGMVVSGDNINNQTTTILKIDKTTTNGVTTYTVYLSAPVPVGNSVSFTFSKPTPIPYSNDPGLQTNLINANGFGADQSFALAFAASVYEMMSVYSTIPEKHTLLPNNSMDLVYEAIGGNVGFLPTASFVNISANVRDLGKSVLRGVPNFLAYPDQHTKDSQWQTGYWYPPPSTPTDGTNYNVFNLDPFVWFVHQNLGLSGYGFSFDDDVSDIGAGGTSSLTVTYASGASALPIQSQWFPSTPWGAVTAMATLSPAGNQYPGKSILTIQPQDVKAFWQLSADDSNNGVVGAYVSSTVPGMIPAGTNLFASYNSNLLQFVLSGTATATTKPIPVTFTGYLPTTLSTSPPPAGSPPPPSSNPGPSGPLAIFQEILALAVDDVLLIVDQMVVLADVALGIVPSPALNSSIVDHQNAINANPINHTLLGQELLGLIPLAVLSDLTGPPIDQGPGSPSCGDRG